ncbi:hypothetical protein [Phaeobacter porticola]|uniref:Uncharacterized protein n=1 Tax=Phaeobacter porticola TaxID=1844006 RepID=A0A1L3IA62_9RHOB|nr:hypothetical protein [Phaeobacter porticola]APG48995.1 hypothetical protein PhaeoP97_03643 [Phaeobacter porticola]
MTSSIPATVGSALLATAITLTLVAGPAFAVDKPVNQAPTRAISTIDWDAARSIRAGANDEDEAIINAFIARDPAGLTEMKLPVMILGANAEADLPAFQGQGNAYTAYYVLEGAQLSIMGAKTLLVNVPGLSFRHDASTYESTGDGADHMFNRFGAFYTLRITCDAPTKDTRCIEPSYLAELAQTLTVAKGSEQ